MSLSLEKIKAMKKIKEEFMDIKKNTIENIGVTVGLPNEDNIFEWKITLKGPRDSSYAGGLFFLRIIFPENYPTKAPEVCFITPIYHLNVNPYNNIGIKLGNVSLNFLNNWKLGYTMKDIFIYIFILLYKPNPDNAYGLERANEFRFNKQLYEDKIKYFTKKYANPGFNDIDKKYDNWDFSYDKLLKKI